MILVDNIGVNLSFKFLGRKAKEVERFMDNAKPNRVIYDGLSSKMTSINTVRVVIKSNYYFKPDWII